MKLEKDEMIFSELRKSIVKLAKSDKNIIVGNEIELIKIQNEYKIQNE